MARHRGAQRSCMNVLLGSWALCLAVYVLLSHRCAPQGRPTERQRPSAVGRRNLAEDSIQSTTSPVNLLRDGTVAKTNTGLGSEPPLLAAGNLFHIIWKRPTDKEHGVWGKSRVLSADMVTGCCDKIIKLCVLSVLAQYPDAQINIWTNDFTQKEWSSRLLDDARVWVRPYDVLKLSEGTPSHDWFKNHTKAHYESVHFADMFRYLVIFRFGGTYIDADSVLVRTLEDMAEQWSLPPENITMLMARADDKCGKRTIDNNGRNPRWIPGQLKEEGSEGRHCASYLSNGMMYRFPANTTFLWRAMEMFAGKYHPECYGCGGPVLVTRSFSSCYADGHPYPYFQQWKRMIRFSQHNNLMDKPKQSHEEIVRQLSRPERALVWHTKLDKGDIKPGSTMSHLLQHFEPIVLQQPEHRSIMPELR